MNTNTSTHTQTSTHTNKEHNMTEELNLIPGIATDAHDVDRNLAEQITEMDGVLGKWVQDGDDVFAYHLEIPVEVLVGKILANEPDRDIHRTDDQVRKTLKNRATQQSTMHPFTEFEENPKTGKTILKPQGIALDIGRHSAVEEAGGRRWALDVPYIHFANLKTSDSLYVKGECECVALVFDAREARKLDTEGKVVRTQMYDGKPYEMVSDWEPKGYVGIAKTFRSWLDMDQARTELIQAIYQSRVVTEGTAMEDDPIRSLDVDQQDAADDKRYDGDIGI